MPNLEIIDLSDNKLVGIPDAIENMPALNALAIASNKIERLPSCLWRMKKLRMIKVHGNPLQYPPAEILEVDPDLLDPKVTNAYEMAMTTKVKEWLWNKHKEKMARMRVDLSPGYVKTSEYVKTSDTSFTVAYTRNLKSTIVSLRDGDPIL